MTAKEPGRVARRGKPRKLFKAKMWAVIDKTGAYYPEIRPFWDEANENKNKWNEIRAGKFTVVYVEVRELRGAKRK